MQEYFKAVHYLTTACRGDRRHSFEFAARRCQSESPAVDRSLHRLHRAQPLTAGVEFRSICSARIRAASRHQPADLSPLMGLRQRGAALHRLPLRLACRRTDHRAQAARVFCPRVSISRQPSASGYARSLLKTDLAAYPALGPALDALHGRQPQPCQTAAQTQPI
jgi:hypothetical protein